MTGNTGFVRSSCDETYLFLDPDLGEITVPFYCVFLKMYLFYFLDYAQNKTDFGILFVRILSSNRVINIY